MILLWEGGLTVDSTPITKNRDKIELFDTTLRDGAQGETISFSIEDKLNVVKALDRLGITYIEAGNPASNPKDHEFFERTQYHPLQNAKLVAFGSTRRRDVPVEEDRNCRALIVADTPVVAIFGKSWNLHVTQVLKTTLEENLQMIRDTVGYFKSHGKEVFFDAEHFFDGYRADASYALESLRAAKEAGADCLVLCDTNGSSLPWEVGRIVKRAAEEVGGRIGIHCHNDIGCAVAGSMAAVEQGAVQVQGTFLGFGERCGNANLSTLIANLQCKMGYDCIGGNLRLLTKTARQIAEISNVTLDNAMPYVGKSAFAHKGGMHVDGVVKNSHTFEHLPPEQVGNSRNFLISEVSGRSAVATKLEALSRYSGRELESFVEVMKEQESKGYQYESATASLEIMALKHFGHYKPFFTLELYKIIGEQPNISREQSATAVVKVNVDGREEIAAAQGQGPVHALDKGLRRALEVFFPQLNDMRLTDYKVRVLNHSAATAAVTRVLIESTDGESVWTTVGVSPDVIEASFRALVDSIEYKLMKDSGILAASPAGKPGSEL